mmetsp:Transcript_19816/g.28315  ORF Transcript_19816/g.28315 Transcript_19816/m.28315 type:complete len:378 (-) Transcript_19816:3026-4159(-)
MSLSRRWFSSMQPKGIKLSKSFLEVSGPETSKFLQGLCSNDVSQLKVTGDSLAVAFFNPKGRILATAILHYFKPTIGENDTIHNEEHIVIETSDFYMKTLAQHLPKFKLRSKVKISTAQVEVLFSPHIPLSPIALPVIPIENYFLSSLDPRIPNFGCKYLRCLSGTDDSNALLNTTNSDAWYNRYKILHGIADGVEVNNRIPLECNLDLLKYISFSKGCYVGQELTARTKFKGIVRKRLIPFLVRRNWHQPTEAFQALDIHTMTQLLNEPFQSDLEVSSRIKIGDKVIVSSSPSSYETTPSSSTSSKQQEIGEVISLSEDNSMGFIMAQLEELQQFKTISHHPYFSLLSMNASNESELEKSVIEDQIVLFRPTWWDI